MANTVIMINKFVDNYETKIKPMMKKLGIDVDSIFSQEDLTPEKEKARPHPERWEPRPEYGLSSYDVSAVGFEGANVFESTEDSHSYGIFSRGMNRVSESGMFNRSGLDINSTLSRAICRELIDASMFGSQAAFSFGGGGSDSILRRSHAEWEDPDIFMTFSGGGHVLEFTSSIEDRIDGMDTGGISKRAEGKTDVNMEYEIMIKEDAMEQTTLYGKNDGIEHVMAWAAMENFRRRIHSEIPIRSISLSSRLPPTNDLALQCSKLLAALRNAQRSRHDVERNWDDTSVQGILWNEQQIYLSSIFCLFGVIITS